MHPDKYKNYDNWSCLFIATQFDRIEIVKILLKYKANVDARTIFAEVSNEYNK